MSIYANEDDCMLNVGHEIMDYRIKFKLSLEELARRAEIPLKRMQMLEDGYGCRAITPKEIARLGKVLHWNCSVITQKALGVIR